MMGFLKRPSGPARTVAAHLAESQAGSFGLAMFSESYHPEEGLRQSALCGARRGIGLPRAVTAVLGALCGSSGGQDGPQTPSITVSTVSRPATRAFPVAARELCRT